VLLYLIKKYLDPNNEYREYSMLRSVEPEKLAALLAKLVPGDITAEEADMVVKQRFQKEGLDRLGLMGNLAQVESAKELVDAVMVDVDGTLIQLQYVKKNGEYVRDAKGTAIQKEDLSPNVLTLMQAMVAAGRQVIVFTGGDPDRQTSRLTEIGLDSKFLPVQSKDQYRGKVLETVIDDTLPQLQGFKALNYYNGKAGWDSDWRAIYELNTETGRLQKKPATGGLAR
jgi:hypothetical protein